MAKRLQEYVKYTTKELDQYTQTKGSCVSKINTNLHLSMGPFCLDDFKHVLMAHIVRSKVGFYDVHLEGIVLDVKNIKVLGTTGAMRADDPKIHVNINADVYVFKPEEGAELTGVVKHIGPLQVGVILYRVFNANLRVAHKVDKSEIQMDQEVKFRIRKYNLQNVFPYIDGELLMPGVEIAQDKAKKTYFNQEDNIDSGIEEKFGGAELDDLLSAIKKEAPSEYEEAFEKSNKQKSKTSKKVAAPSEDSDITLSSLNSATSKKTRKRRSTSCISSPTEEDIDDTSTYSTKNIKRELSFSNCSSPATVKNTKAAFIVLPKKKSKKNKTTLTEETVKIKKEFDDSDC